MPALFDAYRRLSTCRTANGDIPWTAVDAYARRHGIEDFGFLEDAIDSFERVNRAISKMRAEIRDAEGDEAET